MSDLAFTVRPLPGSSLKGAFRVHINPDAFNHLQLTLGEVCVIIGQDGTRGAGIAWRATDRMGNSPKSQPIKMTDVLRDTFGFKQGDIVRIEKSDNTAITPATKVILVDITPDQQDTPNDDRWKMRCLVVLANCEALAVGATFEVSGPEGSKRHYNIEHIESNATDGCGLSYLSDNSQLDILDGPPRSPASTAPSRGLEIDTRRIGGLHKQVEALNLRLRKLCSRARAISTSPKVSYHRRVLIHGFEGTGKTLLLNELCKVSGLKKVRKLQPADLLSTPAKNQNVIQDAFREAQRHQPSMVLIDDLDQIASSTDNAQILNAAYLTEAIDSTDNTQILVVCTARAVTSIHSSLLAPGRLTKHIELPIPDALARQQILAAQLQEGYRLHESTIQRLASITHGFTGADLARLVEEVIDQLDDSVYQGVGDSTQSETLESLTADSSDSSTGSVASTFVEQPAIPNIDIEFADFEHALRTVRPSALREFIIDIPQVTFEDIGGSTALQAKFEKIITWPAKFAEQYAKFNIKPSRGVLLYGPPGCSKTMTAQAVASTYQWNFIAVKGAQHISMYVGESERALRELFRKARQAAPTIIFFDEIDSIASARSTSSDASKTLNVVTTLLTEMDGFEDTKDVLVLAATNKPEALDPAILRAGRFDEHIYLGPPDAAARLEILQMCIKDTPGGHDIDLKPIVERTDGMSGAEVKNAWHTAANLALERSATDQPAKIIPEDLIAGLKQTTRGITKEMLQHYEDFSRRGHEM